MANLSFSSYMPCTCYGPNTKVCTVGCGCPCHSTPEFQQKLELMKQQYTELIARSHGIGERFANSESMEKLDFLLVNIDNVLEMLAWYLRMKNNGY